MTESEKAIQTGLIATDNKNIRFIQKNTKNKKTVCLKVTISVDTYASQSEIFRIPSRDKYYRKSTEK